MIAACWKWVDRRAEVDPLTGEVFSDARTSGPSEADLAALEWALRIGEAWGEPVAVVTAGPAATEGMLRDALAAGARRAIRADLPAGARSEHVAAALAAAIGASSSVVDDPTTVVCGDYSTDRGSGSVPAFLAAHLGAAQALGLVGLTFSAGQPGVLAAERRLDGGRREKVRAPVPVVVSVEGASARLRRSPLDGVLHAKTATIEVLPAPTGPAAPSGPPVKTMPYRPRARVLPPPAAELDARQRILALTGALVERTPPQRLALSPAEAADRILDQLRAWGELDE